MHGMKKIIQEAAALPVEERVAVVDSLLRTLNVPNPDIDTAWVEVARQRLADLRSGRAKAVPGNEVFARVRRRISQ